MKRIKLNILLLLMTAVFVAGCNKEEEFPFAGGDNYISSFELTKDGVTLKGAVSSGNIVITAPERFSLDGATASVTLSENATITPNPATVTDWSGAQSFTVTAYNGSKKTYAYTVTRSLVVNEGNVTLLTQADVEAFAALGIDQINGGLIVGAATGTDSVYSLAPLSGLRIVTDGITINATYAGENFAGLESLEKTNELRIISKLMKTVSLPKLTTLHSDLVIGLTAAAGGTNRIETIDLPELVSVEKGLQLIYLDSLANLNIPKLQQITGSLTVQGRSSSTSVIQKLQTVDFPALETVGEGISITNNSAITKVNLPKLTSVGGAINVTGLANLIESDFSELTSVGGTFTLSSLTNLPAAVFPKLASVGGTFTLSSLTNLPAAVFPKLASINGNVSISSLAKLVNISFPVLKTATTISISSCASLAGIDFTELETANAITLPPSNDLASIRFPALTSVTTTITIAEIASQATLQFSQLKTVGVDLRIQATTLASLEAFSAVETIGSRLYLYNASGLTSLAGLSSIDSVTTIYASGLTNLAEIDLRNIKTDRLELYGSTMTGLTITGNEEFPGTLYINNIPSGNTNIPITVQGIKTVGSLAIYYPNTVEISLPWLEHITGELNLNGSTIQKVDFPNLQSVGRIYFNGLEAITTCSFPALKTITKSGFFYQIMAYGTYGATTIEFPELESVVGDINITNQYTNRFHVSTIRFPKLETIDGALSLTGTTNHSEFTDLSGFSALKSAASVTIYRFQQLKNFEPLKNVIPSLNADTWKVTECGYNPSFQDMTEGKYSN
jgi:hypothetical protein